MRYPNKEKTSIWQGLVKITTCYIPVGSIAVVDVFVLTELTSQRRVAVDIRLCPLGRSGGLKTSNGTHAEMQHVCRLHQRLIREMFQIQGTERIPYRHPLHDFYT